MLGDLVQYAVLDGTGAYHQKKGVAADELNFEAIYNDGAGKIANILADARSFVTDSHTGPAGGGGQFYDYGMMILYGQNLGDPAIAADEVRIKKYEVKGVVSDIVRFSADMVVDDTPFRECKVLCGKRTEELEGATLGLDNGAAAGTGLIACLEIFEVAADTTFDIIIEHSTNNVDWEPLVTVCYHCSTVGHIKATTAVDPYRYLRATWIINPAYTPHTATFAIIVKREGG
jgi:hypothetical protein